MTDFPTIESDEMYAEWPESESTLMRRRARHAARPGRSWSRIPLKQVENLLGDLIANMDGWLESMVVEFNAHPGSKREIDCMVDIKILEVRPPTLPPEHYYPSKAFYEYLGTHFDHNLDWKSGECQPIVLVVSRGGMFWQPIGESKYR